ncbi:MAG: biotin/lipoyl-containing protein [bacterium]|nr:biotin/lipoyl-containing protein [bacterium]
MKRSFKVLLDNEEHTIDVETIDNGYRLSMNGNSHRFDLLLDTPALCSFLIDGSDVLEVDAKFNQDKCTLNVQNVSYHLEVFDPRRRKISQSNLSNGNGQVQAPMPGKIIDVLVKAGDVVEQGQAVVVMEAMKMQNELTAPIKGVVQEISVQAGDAVEADQKLALVVRE